MASLNKAMILGNLGDNPEVRSTPNGQTVATLRIATNERWTDKDGQAQERTEWHRVVVWGRQAEQCGTYLSKGRQVFVEGRIQTREWTDKEGHRRFTTEVIAQRIQFLGNRAGGSGNPAADGAPVPSPMGPADEEDVPF
ncbi:MAG: single-stranded DNA-binding protein [Deltaproteobacteria bacterium]|nr:single-stranded DNA-binding protein [Deltaproteobacteria bacterium]